MRFVIIGNSAAGIFAAEAIRLNDKLSSVDILTDEQYPAYARCLTSYYLTGKVSEEQLFLRPADFYSRLNLNLHTCENVVRVDVEGHRVHTASGGVYHYDKLLIATGASSARLTVPGIEFGGVFGLRTLKDAKQILEYAGSDKNAIVVGGGLVALKAAYALLRTGMTVTCVISSGQILSQMLDREAAAIVSRVLQSGGLKIRYCTDIKEIVGRVSARGPVVSGVRLADGEELPADLVIVGKGVTPNVGFLAGTQMDTDYGIIVDKTMQTSIPDIYAAGDVAQTYDVISGERKINAIWPNATEQGAIAGSNMTGRIKSYSGSLSMNSADFFGLSAIAAGQSRGTGEGYETVQLFPAPEIYRCLTFKGEVLVGFIMVGKTSKAGLLTSWIKERVPLGKVKADLLQGRITQRMLW